MSAQLGRATHIFCLCSEPKSGFDVLALSRILSGFRGGMYVCSCRGARDSLRIVCDVALCDGSACRLQRLFEFRFRDRRSVRDGFVDSGESVRAHMCLRPNDQIRLQIYGEANVSGVYTIDGGGLVSIPLAGRIHAAGLTAAESRTHDHETSHTAPC